MNILRNLLVLGLFSFISTGYCGDKKSSETELQKIMIRNMLPVKIVLVEHDGIFEWLDFRECATVLDVSDVAVLVHKEGYLCKEGCQLSGNANADIEFTVEHSLEELIIDLVEKENEKTECVNRLNR